MKIQFLSHQSGDLAYFSSNREKGYGSLDLYSFNIDDKFKPLPVQFLKGRIIDADTKTIVSIIFNYLI